MQKKRCSRGCCAPAILFVLRLATQHTRCLESNVCCIASIDSAQPLPQGQQLARLLSLIRMVTMVTIGGDLQPGRLADWVVAAKKVVSQRNPGNKVQNACHTRGAKNKLLHQYNEKEHVLHLEFGCKNTCGQDFSETQRFRPAKQPIQLSRANPEKIPRQGYVGLTSVACKWRSKPSL
eukprot:1156776-Pelagomonas_calceolata.AAC.2